MLESDKKLSPDERLRSLADAVLTDPKLARDLAADIVLERKDVEALIDELEEGSRPALYLGTCQLCADHPKQVNIIPQDGDRITRYDGETVHLDCAVDAVNAQHAERQGQVAA